MRKPRAAPASSNAAAATGSGGLHVKENGVRTAVNAGKRNGDDFGCRLEAVAGTRVARGSAVGRWRPDDVLGASERRPTWEKEEGSSGRLRRAHHGGNGTRTAFGQRRSAAFGPGAVGTLGGFRQAVGWGHIRDRRRRPGRPIGAQRAATESLPCGSQSSALFHFWKIWRLDFHTRKIDRKGGKIIENLWS
jgi:hypothetical protein